MNIKAICIICGSSYMKKNGKSKYCSDECKRVAARERQRRFLEKDPDYHKRWREAHPGYCNVKSD